MLFPCKVRIRVSTLLTSQAPTLEIFAGLVVMR